MMRTVNINSSTLAALLLIGMFVCGCSQVQVAGLAGQTITQDDIGSDDAYVTELKSYRDGDSTVIYGKVKRGPDSCCDDVRGHVDIAVFDSEGILLETVSKFYSPRNIPKNRTRSSSFKVRLPTILSQGTTVRAAYHDSDEHAVFTKGQKTFQCLLNLALPGLQAKAYRELDVY
jgi:hypothetical protein